MRIIEHKWRGGGFSLLLVDGRRWVAKARHVRSTNNYIITGYGLSLLDKPGGPLAPNAFGHADPSRMLVRGVRAARRALRELGMMDDEV